VRLRLIIGSLVLTAAVTIAFFVPAGIALASAEREAQVVELQQEAADAAASASSGLQPGGVSLDDPLREAKRRGEREHEYALYDVNGTRTTGDGPLRLEPTLRSALVGHSRTGRSGGDRIAAVPLPGGGALRASEPANEADERVRSALLRLAGQGLALLLLASAGTWGLASRLTRPLRDLGVAAARLGGGDFTTKASLSGVREVDEVATALNATADRLGSTVERMRRLSVDASHQMRTPLTGLRASLETELLQPRPDATEALREALGAVERLEQTVSDLTELARDEVEAEALSTGAVLDAAAARWGAPLAAAGRSLILEPDTGATARARRPAVDAILDVLVDNALHHGAGAVTLGSDLGGGGVTLRVSDRGECHSSEVELFARRGPTAGRRGIGLPLARALAEAEGGRLRLASTDPTTFHLQLPTGDVAGDAGGLSEPSPRRGRRSGWRPAGT
jgi:signal transduction histidine kinase